MRGGGLWLGTDPFNRGIARNPKLRVQHGNKIAHLRIGNDSDMVDPAHSGSQGLLILVRLSKQRDTGRTPARFPIQY